MKINPTPGVARLYEQNRVKQTERQDASARPSKGDGVLLSKEAQDVLAMREKIGQIPDVRKEKVEELRRQIEAGTYGPTGQQVADKMLKARVFDDLA